MAERLTGGRWWEQEYPPALHRALLERIGPRSPGMGNPPAFLWEIATPEGVAHVLAIAAIRALRDLPVEERMATMRMEPTYDTHDNKPTWVEHTEDVSAPEPPG